MKKCHCGTKIFKVFGKSFVKVPIPWKKPIFKTLKKFVEKIPNGGYVISYFQKYFFGFLANNDMYFYVNLRFMLQ
jgi:hypothetical protein